VLNGGGKRAQGFATVINEVSAMVFHKRIHPSDDFINFQYYWYKLIRI
jgi:hypothetical protein